MAAVRSDTERAPDAIPPERVSAGALVLRRPVAGDAGALARAVEESLEHLHPWMPWATPDAATVEAQRQRLARVWDNDEDFPYVLVDGEGTIVGSCGLHRRLGPGGLEIGYWVHVDHVRRGYATAAAGALTRTALALPGIERVEIHCDEANRASAAVPRRLGYRLDRIEEETVTAPAETGRTMVWVTTEPPRLSSGS